MTLYAIAATVGTPDSAAVVPITTNNLNPLISAAISSANLAVTDGGTMVTGATTLHTSTSALVGSANTVVASGGVVITDLATELAKHDSACSSLLSGLTSNSGTLAYSTSTHLFTGAAATGTITSANMVTIISAINAEATAILATSAAMSAADSANSACDGLATGVNVLAVSNLANAVVVSNDASATKVATSAVIVGTGGNNLLCQFDTAVITTAATLNGALAETLDFVKNAGILT